MSTVSRKEVLDLLAQGKIDVDEAAEMLAAVKAETAAPPPSPKPEPEPEPAPAKPAPAPEALNTAAPGDMPKWLRVRISDLETGKNRVRVNIPVRMLKFGFTIASQFTPAAGQGSMDQLREMLAEGESGILVDVEDEDSKEHVQVYLE